jgi:hypothetical protein
MRIDRIGFKAILRCKGDITDLWDSYRMALFRADLHTVKKIISSLTREEAEFLRDNHETIAEKKELLQLIERKFGQFAAGYN